MLNIIKELFSKIYDVLPSSPFQTFWDNVNFDFVGWLNWFIPFDICFQITEIWAISIAAFYLFSIVKKVIFDLILKKIAG